MITTVSPFDPPFAGSVTRYYAGALRAVLRRPARLLAFVTASAMHAVGHAAVALLGGALVVAMARMWGMGGAQPLDPEVQGDRALRLALLGLGVLALKAVAGIYASYVQGRVAGEVASGLRLELLDALLEQHRVRRPRHGDQGSSPGLAGASPVAGVAALTERVHEVEVGLESGMLGGLRAVTQLVPLAVVLVVLSPHLGVVAVVVLALFTGLLGRARGGFRRASSREAREREELMGAADESVRHADLWVSYGAEERARSRVRQLGEALTVSGARLRARAAGQSGANEVLGALALVLVVAASRSGWLGRVDDGGTLLGFAVAFFLAYRPLRELTDARLALARADVAFEHLRRALGPRGDATAPAPAAAWAPGALELRGLRLAHGACEPLDLRVEAGSVVAIAGATGVGKTTLLRTLLGLEGAAGGDVLYDGKSLGDAPAGPSSRPFAWVPQEAPLLASTLRENVALAPGARDDAHEALAPLGAAHLADALGGDRLGPGGRVVSGGERQWIALARAIATRQPVLLLDEPTSGLDPESQTRVLDAIRRLRGQRTVVLVTHRTEPLAVADRVVRLGAA